MTNINTSQMWWADLPMTSEPAPKVIQRFPHIQLANLQILHKSARCKHWRYYILYSYCIAIVIIYHVKNSSGNHSLCILISCSLQYVIFKSYFSWSLQISPVSCLLASSRTYNWFYLCYVCFILNCANKRASGSSCCACSHRDPTPDKWRKMDGFCLHHTSVDTDLS